MKILGTKDAYGHAMYDRYQGKDVTVLIERDDGYLDTDATIDTYFEDPRKASGHAKQVLDRVKGRVLDIGCGAGRHALYLQEKGHDVLGIDVCPRAVKVCKERGLRKARVLSVDDVSPKLGTFDSVIMFGNNFGLFGSPAKMKTILKKLDAATSDDARIYAECMDPYGTDFPPHLAYHKYNRKRGRMSGQLRIRVRYHNHASDWFDYLFASRKEIEGLLKGTAWEVVGHTPEEEPHFVVEMQKRN